MFLITKEDYYQWDTGQRVELYPDGGAEITELHMYNDRIGGPALVLPIKNDENGTRYADIPDLLFQRAGRIIFWGAVSDTHGSVTVEEHDGINVLPRAKPTDYVYTAPDVLNYKDLLLLYKTLSEQYNDLLKKLDAGAFAAGGYYTPEITQLDDSTMQVAFVPSQENMAQVLAQRVSLPPGPAGPQGEMGSPGVYVQDEEPTDPDWKMWIKPTGGYNLRIPDATAEMTQPVGRNADGQLVTAPGGGGVGEVPDWAMQPEKPTYTAEEVGAQPKGDYIPAPETAEVGQTIVVKAVDENGKPTEWEAADAPGGGKWAKKHESARVEVTEAITQIEIDLGGRVMSGKEEYFVQVELSSSTLETEFKGAVNCALDGFAIGYFVLNWGTSTSPYYFDLHGNVITQELQMVSAAASLHYNAINVKQQRTAARQASPTSAGKFIISFPAEWAGNYSATIFVK